jgi:two-component sensor histidine kinase
MSWLEEGGPKVPPPSHKGFGQMVIGQMVEAAVDGTVKSDYRESGLSWKLNASVAGTLEGGRVDPLRSNVSR